MRRATLMVKSVETSNTSMTASTAIPRNACPTDMIHLDAKRHIARMLSRRDDTLCMLWLDVDG
jgi:hypothetical protein